MRAQGRWRKGMIDGTSAGALHPYNVFGARRLMPRCRQRWGASGNGVAAGTGKLAQRCRPGWTRQGAVVLLIWGASCGDASCAGAALGVLAIGAAGAASGAARGAASTAGWRGRVGGPGARGGVVVAASNFRQAPVHSVRRTLRLLQGLAADRSDPTGPLTTPPAFNTAQNLGASLLLAASNAPV